MISERELSFIKENPLQGAINIALEIIGMAQKGLSYEDMHKIVDLYAILDVLVKSQNWKIELPAIEPSNNESVGYVSVDMMPHFLESLRGMSQNNTYMEAKQHYENMLGVGTYYELTDGDVQRIQGLINTLRQEINSSTFIGDDHKRRLLARIEKLQAELHKRMSDYDRFYGIMIDGAVLIQKFGESVRPITELIREIGNLVWRSQIRAEQLPGDAILRLPEDTKK